jgi:predicted MPP superfamily phosphohydrolase
VALKNPIKESRRRLAAGLQKITASESPFRVFAESVSGIAREAFYESQNLIVERQKVILRRLPRSFDNLRVAQLSDVHHSPTTSAAQITRAVELANELQPDLTVLTGDYVSHEIEYIAPVAEILGKLTARYGVYAVLGNHDHLTDAPMLTDLFRAENIKVLSNEGFRFEIGSESVWFCGVDDATLNLHDLTLALSGAKKDEFKFLLSHNPSILRQAAHAGVDLILSGHTHGGQIRLRQNDENAILPRTRSRSGLFHRGATQIYISRGIGTVVLPVRYQCPPEITLLELKCANNFGF